MSMKIVCEHLENGEDEIVIRYKTMTEEIENVLKYLKEESNNIIGQSREKKYVLKPSLIYYFESVDNSIFAYTKDGVYEVNSTLNDVESKFSHLGFFRCNKSFVLNINKILSLKSEIGSRIDAELVNGEHIIVSRRYSKSLREILREGRNDGEY